MELVAANELRPEHSVDVLRQTRAGVVEGLTFEGRREEPAEHRGPYEQDPGAREQEDMQKRDRATERPATGNPWSRVRRHLVLRRLSASLPDDLRVPNLESGH